jgi:hypothetical protein
MRKGRDARRLRPSLSKADEQDTVAQVKGLRYAGCLIAKTVREMERQQFQRILATK